MKNLRLQLLFILYFKEIIFQLQGSYVKTFGVFFLYYSQHNKHYGLTPISK